MTARQLIDIADLRADMAHCSLTDRKHSLASGQGTRAAAAYLAALHNAQCARAAITAAEAKLKPRRRS